MLHIVICSSMVDDTVILFFRALAKSSKKSAEQAKHDRDDLSSSRKRDGSDPARGDDSGPAVSGVILSKDADDKNNPRRALVRAARAR